MLGGARDTVAGLFPLPFHFPRKLNPRGSSSAWSNAGIERVLLVSVDAEVTRFRSLGASAAERTSAARMSGMVDRRRCRLTRTGIAVRPASFQVRLCVPPPIYERSAVGRYLETGAIARHTRRWPSHFQQWRVRHHGQIHVLWIDKAVRTNGSQSSKRAKKFGTPFTIDPLMSGGDCQDTALARQPPPTPVAVTPSALGNPLGMLG